MIGTEIKSLKEMTVDELRLLAIDVGMELLGRPSTIYSKAEVAREFMDAAIKFRYEGDSPIRPSFMVASQKVLEQWERDEEEKA